MEMVVHGNALLALAAAVLWGGGDFSGGIAVNTAGPEPAIHTTKATAVNMVANGNVVPSKGVRA